MFFVCVCLSSMLLFPICVCIRFVSFLLDSFSLFSSYFWIVQTRIYEMVDRLISVSRFFNNSFGFDTEKPSLSHLNLWQINNFFLLSKFYMFLFFFWSTLSLSINLFSRPKCWCFYTLLASSIWTHFMVSVPLFHSDLLFCHAIFDRICLWIFGSVWKLNG